MSELQPVTVSLLNSINRGDELRPEVIADFGLSYLPQRFAIMQAVRLGWISAEQLDAAIGDGPKITALVAEFNPFFPGLVYRTPWDVDPSAAARVHEIGSKESQSAISVVYSQTEQRSKMSHPFLPADPILRAEPLVTLKEAARFLRMSERSVGQKARDKIIPSVKIGGSRRFQISRLQLWLESEMQDGQRNQ